MKPLPVVPTEVKIATRPKRDKGSPADSTKRSARSYFRHATILCGLYFLVGLIAAQATIVISVRDASEIVIGADSRVTIRKEQTWFSACKILQHKDTIASFSGTFNPSIGFNLPEIARQVIQHDDLTLAEKIDLFYDSTLKKAEPLVKESRTTDRERYSEWLAGRPVCEVLFASIERGRPIMYLAGIVVSRDGTLSPSAPLKSVNDFRADEREIWPQGESTAVREFMSRPPFSWTKDPSLSVVKQLMGIAMKAKPVEVGEPFSILRITSEGVVWVERGACGQ